MTSPGTRLGPYVLDEPLGAGGMGEVWRATDTRLGRSVAVKIIASSLLADAKIRARFDAEARAISKVTHPNVCALYDVGNAEGVNYLVMEHIEGENLATRLVRGPLPLDQALVVGAEIAAALDHAHRKSIVHRDLKPANVMLTKSGAKLLDFGLAHLIHDHHDASPVSRTDPQTAQGTVIGTWPYMAPEQIEGRPVDQRTDIFALGCLLYEMMTSRRAFPSETQSGVAAAILSREPETLPATIPRAVAHVVTRCLAKDPDNRFQTARDVELELKWLRTQPDTQIAPAASSARNGLLATTALVVIAGAAVLIAFMRNSPRTTQRPVYASILAPPGTTFLAARSFELSPDGRKIVFAARNPQGQRSLWLRRLDSPFAVPLAGTQHALHPFWSPDSSAIAFVADGALQKISVAGTPPEILALATSTIASGTWNANGVILYSDDPNAIYRTTANGGPRSVAARLAPNSGSVVYLAPRFLPDGDHFTFVTLEGHAGSAWLASLSSPPKFLFATDSPVVYCSGHLVFERGGALLAQRFDASHGLPIGEIIKVQGGVRAFSVSDQGVLAYRAGPPLGVMEAIESTRLTWFRRDGTRREDLPVMGADQPHLSPDGSRMIFLIQDETWTSDATGRGLKRLTLPDGVESLWAGADTLLTFDRTAHTLSRVSMSTGTDQELKIRLEGELDISDVSADGHFLLFMKMVPMRYGDLFSLNLVDGRVSPFISTPGWEVDGHFAPDGRHVVYEGLERIGGRSEVYVRDFPNGRQQWRISPAGGSMPSWRADGKEILYATSDGTIMSAAVRAGPALEFDPPVPLFRVHLREEYGREYDVTPDGQNFIVTEVVAEEEPITLVTNWRLPQ